MPSLRVNRFEFLDKPLTPSRRHFELSKGENFVILACNTVLVRDREIDATTAASTVIRGEVGLKAIIDW